MANEKPFLIPFLKNKVQISNYKKTYCNYLVLLKKTKTFVTTLWFAYQLAKRGLAEKELENNHIL